MVNSYRYVSITLKHDDWTSITENFVEDNLRVDTVEFIPIFTKRRVVSTMYISSKNWKTIEKIIGIVKSYKNIYDVKVIGFIRGKRNSSIAILNKVHSLDGSIVRIFLENNIPFFKEKVQNGYEIWEFLAKGEQLHVIEKAIKENAEIHSIKSLNVESYLAEISKATLTPREKQVLRLALRYGYFNWPKEINSSELAKILGVNKVTLLQELRNATKKLIVKDINTWADLDNISY